MNLDYIVDKHHKNDTGFCRHYLTLYSIVLGMETQSAFEFGCGFSTKTILEALKETGGKLITCDPRSIDGSEGGKSTGNSKEDIEKYAHCWKYIQKISEEGLKDLTDETFDFVLHDGSHTLEIVREDIKTIVPRIKKDGLLLLHDTEHPTSNFNLIDAIDWLDCRFSRVTLPYGYGLTIVRIEEDFGNGEVKIKWRKEK